MSETYDEKSYKILEKMSINQEKDMATKDLILKTGVAGVAGLSGAFLLQNGIDDLKYARYADKMGYSGSEVAKNGIAGGLLSLGGVALGGYAIYKIVQVIKNLKERKQAEKDLKEVKEQEEIDEKIEQIEMGRGL